MSAAVQFLKNFTARSARRLGYRIERIVDLRETGIDVFDVLVRYVHSTRRDGLFFVQIGANDGVINDPIRSYVKEFHWRGVLVEPQPHVFAKLLENYRDEPQLSFENAAIARRDGSMVLYAPESYTSERGATGLVTFDKAILQKSLGSKAPIVELRVPALSLSSLLAKNGIHSIDLLQIDTEGFDFEIIKMVEETGIWPTIIRFEHHHLSQPVRQECFTYLSGHGYRLHRDEIDIIAYRSQVPTAEHRQVGKVAVD